MRASAQRFTVGKVSFIMDTFRSKVDKTMDCWKWTGSKNANGYGQINAIVDGRKTTVRTHRIAFEMEHGLIPEGMEVDHTCHTRACVNPAHLRLTTHKQNAENHSGVMARNTSGHRGVTWNKGNGTWWARVTHNGRQIHAGYFDTPEAAGAAAAAKRLELFTHNDVDRIAS